MASTVWRGFITFGVISIPVRLFRAARAERVSLRRLHREAPSPKVEEASEEETDSRRSFASSPAARASQLNQPRLTLVSKSLASNPVAPPVSTPVKQASISHDSEEVIPAESVVKGFEYEKDRFVAIDPKS
jgi:non-homologous end joining protein Ku